MSHVFISHAAADFEAASRIRERLEQAGISTWMAMTDLVPGTEDWASNIDKAIKDADSMVLVLSHAALNSAFVTSEYRYILSQNKRLYPVLIEPIPASELSSSLRSIQYFDLTRNEETNLERLILTLKSPSSLAETSLETSTVNVRLKVDRNKLATLVSTLLEAGVEKIEVENVGGQD